MIYLDYQATTPVAPEVEKAMAPWVAEKFANPPSPSKWGSDAEAAIGALVLRKQLGDRGGCLERLSQHARVQSTLLPRTHR